MHLCHALNLLHFLSDLVHFMFYVMHPTFMNSTPGVNFMKQFTSYTEHKMAIL
jgi:hypothetical protein